MKRKKIAIWSIVAAAGVAVAITVILRTGHWRPGMITVQGAVIRNDQDTRREVPIADAVVSASDGVMTSTAKSNASGYFKLTFRERVWPAEVVTISFTHPDYRPVNLQLLIGLRSNQRRLYITPMDPVAPEAGSKQPQSVISNVRVRYTVNSQSQANIGTAVKTFQVENKGNVPCQHRYPCSPDGVWKGSTGSTTLDAGSGNEFRNVRVSCFSGPCPFTRIDSSGFSHGGRTITASALDWSDTATFLLEAEVFRESNSSNVRESYPVIFGRVMHFTLPASQEGVSIEAEVDGAPMVFPLGSDLYMSWAQCTSRTGTEGEQSIAFQCELKPGYRF